MLAVAFTAWEATRAHTALRQVAADFESIADRLAAGDVAAAEATLEGAQDAADRADRSTHGPVWWLGSRLPGIGDDVEAVRVVASVAEGLASDALPDVIRSAGALDPARLRPVDGRVDLDPIVDVAPSVVRAAETIASLDRDVAALDLEGLVSPVAGPVSDLQARIGDAASLADRASRAVRLLPPMLGSDGPRSYVLMFQNNAESRATGGIPGAFAVLNADDGRLRLGAQSDSARLGRSARPVLPLTDDEERLFGEKLARFPQDVNLTPDFPRTGQLVRAMWERRYGVSVDGVVSTDPVALSYLLQGTGPVDSGGVRVASDTAVPLLLSQVYADLPDPEQQNRFFDLVARGVFGAVVSGAGDAGQVLDGLARSVEERRTLVWSAHREEQGILAPTALAGGFPTEVDETPHVGVYLNATVPYKLDYYLDHEADVEATRCRNGRQRLTVTVRLSSTVPDDVSALTHYVAPEAPLVGRGAIAQTMYLAAPVDAEVLSLRVDGRPASPQVGSYGRRPVVLRAVAVEPGATREIVVELLTGQGQTGDPELRATPAVRSDGTGEVSPSACS